VEVADQLFFLGIDRNHGLASGLKVASLAVDVPELSVAIRMRRAFAGLGQRLQAVAELVQ
jgi:hypothetical protein